MKAKPSARIDNATKTLKTNEKKWSKQLMDAGWTVIPNVIIERQQAIGLDALDMNILLHLASYWWTHENKPHPSKTTIADAIGVAPRTIQRRIAALERGGLVHREERRIPGKGSKTNIYHFKGLIDAARPFAMEKIAEIKSRQKANEDRIKRKGPPKLRVVKDKENR